MMYVLLKYIDDANRPNRNVKMNRQQVDSKLPSPPLANR